MWLRSGRQKRLTSVRASSIQIVTVTVLRNLPAAGTRESIVLKALLMMCMTSLMNSILLPSAAKLGLQISMFSLRYVSNKYLTCVNIAWIQLLLSTDFTMPAGSPPPEHESWPTTSIDQDDEHDWQDETDLFGVTPLAPAPKDQDIDYGNDFTADPLLETDSILSTEDLMVLTSLDSTDASIWEPLISRESGQSNNSSNKLGMPDKDQDHQNVVTLKNVLQETCSQVLCCAPLTNTENISAVLPRPPLVGLSMALNLLNAKGIFSLVF